MQLLITTEPLKKDSTCSVEVHRVVDLLRKRIIFSKVYDANFIDLDRVYVDEKEASLGR